MVYMGRTIYCFNASVLHQESLTVQTAKYVERI